MELHILLRGGCFQFIRFGSQISVLILGIRYVFLYQGLSFQIKDLKIRKFRDKYLLCVFPITNFSYTVRWPAGATRDPRRVLGLHRLVGFSVVLI